MFLYSHYLQLLVAPCTQPLLWQIIQLVSDAFGSLVWFGIEFFFFLFSLLPTTLFLLCFPAQLLCTWILTRTEKSLEKKLVLNDAKKDNKIVFSGLLI